VQQQQLQQTSAPPAPNPPATSLPPDFATTMMAASLTIRGARMPKWITCPRTHGPSGGTHHHPLPPQVCQWTSG
jgi:hypothetical protein